MTRSLSGMVPLHKLRNTSPLGIAWQTKQGLDYNPNHLRVRKLHRAQFIQPDRGGYIMPSTFRRVVCFCKMWHIPGGPKGLIFSTEYKTHEYTLYNVLSELC